MIWTLLGAGCTEEDESIKSSFSNGLNKIQIDNQILLYCHDRGSTKSGSGLHKRMIDFGCIL